MPCSKWALGEGAGRRGARGTRRTRHSRGRPWREAQRTGSVGHSSLQCARLGQKTRARAKRLIAQARRPRIKNAHSADQEIFKVAPQFVWMIFNRCKKFALLSYDRLGRPLQTFMSAGIPRPLASMTRQDIAKILVDVFSCRVGTAKSPQRQFCAVFRHDDETLLECLCVPFSGTRISSGSLLRTRNPLPKSG